MKLSPDQEQFRLQHEILAKRDLMDELVSRHNQLVSMLPKEIVSDDVALTFQLTLAEIERNKDALLQVVAELEDLCSRSPFFQRQQMTEA
jgi:hypothetical protein